MLSALLAGALIAAASLLRPGDHAARGPPRPSPVAPAAGLSALLVICGIAIKLPGHGPPPRSRPASALSRPPGRCSSRARAGWGAVRAAPAAVSARPGRRDPVRGQRAGRVLGQGLVNDDMASHLLFTEWIDTHDGPNPGPGRGRLSAGAARPRRRDGQGQRRGLIEAFAGLTGAIAVAAALTAYGALAGHAAGSARRPRCWPRSPTWARPTWPRALSRSRCWGWPCSASRSALPALRTIWSTGSDGPRHSAGGRPPRGPRAKHARGGADGRPAGVIAAGTIYNYSFPGLAWLVVARVVWALLVAWSERAPMEGLEAARAALRWAPTADRRRRDPGDRSAPGDATGSRASPASRPSTPGQGRQRRLRQPAPATQPAGGARGSGRRASSGSPPENSTTPEIAFYLGGLLASRLSPGASDARSPAARRRCPRRSRGGARLPGRARGRHPHTQAKALAIARRVVMLLALRGLLRRRRARARGA